MNEGANDEVRRVRGTGVSSSVVVNEMREATGDKLSAAGRAALRLLGLGWSVLPLEPRGKRPLLPWQPYQDKAVSRDDAKAWFRRWPDANIGIVTGNVSGFIVLDIDPQHGGEESLGGLERAHDRLPETVEVVTGGGGRHLYFAHPGGHVRNRVGIAQGVDMRGDGGYVVAPPSIHPSGRKYAWRPGHAPWEMPLAPAPNWILTAVGGVRSGRPLAEWRRLVHEGVQQGTRNSTIASLTGHLLWHGVDPEVALELMLAWNRMRCRPPLEDEEVAGVVRSITRLHESQDGG